MQKLSLGLYNVPRDQVKARNGSRTLGFGLVKRQKRETFEPEPWLHLVLAQILLGPWFQTDSASSFPWAPGFKRIPGAFSCLGLGDSLIRVARDAE